MSRRSTFEFRRGDGPQILLEPAEQVTTQTFNRMPAEIELSDDVPGFSAALIAMRQILADIECCQESDRHSAPETKATNTADDEHTGDQHEGHRPTGRRASGPGEDYEHYKPKEKPREHADKHTRYRAPRRSWRPPRDARTGLIVQYGLPTLCHLGLADECQPTGGANDDYSASNFGIISSKFSRAVTERSTPFLSIRNIVGMASMP